MVSNALQIVAKSLYNVTNRGSETSSTGLMSRALTSGDRLAGGARVLALLEAVTKGGNNHNTSGRCGTAKTERGQKVLNVNTLLETISKRRDGATDKGSKTTLAQAVDEPCNTGKEAFQQACVGVIGQPGARAEAQRRGPP